MGFRDPSTINNVGAVGSATNPLTGTALAMDRENQKSIMRLNGTLDWEQLTILDGAITPKTSEVIVDTEGEAPTDELSLINLTSDGTTTLHTGMRIKIKSADPSRIVTIKHNFGGGNIRTASGADIVLGIGWEVEFKLVGGIWEESVPKAEEIARDAQTSANTALGRTAPAATTSRGISREATLADMEPGTVIENGPAFLSAGGGVVTPTPTAHAVVQADASGKIDDWVSLSGKANISLDNINSAAKNVIRDATKIKTLSTCSSLGAWTITGCSVDHPLLIVSQRKTAAVFWASFKPTSGCKEVGEFWQIAMQSAYATPNCIILNPTGPTVVIEVGGSIDTQTIRAYN